MKSIFYIETQNHQKQILVFTTKNKAVGWAKKATTWNDEQIEKEVKESVLDWRGFFNIFPTPQ